MLDVDGRPIRLNPLIPSEINSSGEIIQDGEVVATIQVMDYEDYDYLERFGENYFQPVEGAQEKDPEEITTQVYSGYLETSNISVVSEMVNMITVARSYESNQKVITTYDGTLDIAANQLGRLS